MLLTNGGQKQLIPTFFSAWGSQTEKKCLESLENLRARGFKHTEPKQNNHLVSIVALTARCVCVYACMSKTN